MKDSDASIVSEILNGNTELYKDIVDRYSPMLFHIVRSFEKNEEEVKGLVQEIFVKIYIRLNQFKGNSKFSSWMYTIGLNHCRDYAKNVRRSNMRFSELDENYAEQEVSDSDQPDEEMEKAEQKKNLFDAVKKLSPDKSAPLLMKYRDGMSYKAISEQMNISETALKVRVHRARSELKQLLNG
ncbi:MAG: sigma-70 family RNA polymerase sigma factor [Balneolaceae bacterium]